MAKGYLYDNGDELITREDVNEVPDSSTAHAGDVLELDSNKKPKWTTPESELPSTGSASAGDVLTLDEDKDPVWSAPSGGFDVNVKFTVTAGSSASNCLYKFYKTDGTSYSYLIDLIDVADENGYFYALWVSQIGSDVNLGIDEAGMLCRFKIFNDNGTYKIVIPKLFLTLYISGGTKFVRTDAAVQSFADTATAEMSDSITAFSFAS